MVKISAYLLNTMPVVQQWHLTSLASQFNYFSQDGIKLNVLDDKHYLVRQLINLPLCPLLRKFIRIYDFLDSGDDYGLFMDLDTFIINKKRHSNNIRDWCRDGISYIDYKNFPQLETVEPIPDWDALPFPWYLKSRIFIQKAFVEHLDITLNQYIVFNTGFALLTREFCESLVTRLEKFNLSLSSKQGLDNILEIEKIVSKKAGCSTRWVQDEHLIELAINTTNNDSALESFQKKIKNCLEICSHGWDIKDFREFRSGDPCKFNFSKIINNDSIFLHTTSCSKDDDLNSMFKIVGG
tara:strand:- start:27377 stop:28264 length:888 start_codon:yes stop_codon:yes gene_type:complete